MKLYFLRGALTVRDVQRLCGAILADPVVEDYSVDMVYRPDDVVHTVDVTFLPGVTDSVAENLLKAAQVMGIHTLDQAASGQRFLLYRQRDDLDKLAVSVFSNPLIQRHSIDQPINAPFVEAGTATDHVDIIALCDADDERLLAISQERRLSLDLNEMRAIRDYFHGEEREPTDAELEMLAQTWSEHCVHKTFKARITYEGPAHGAEANATAQTQQIDGLLNTYIRAATEHVAKDWVRSAFVDNAGIVRFDDGYDLAFKVETHNRPSALEPFGGANTGAGGVIRDVLGVSAKPIANTDILFFGHPDTEKVPDGVLHPRRVAEGVVAGIEDYGNKMGIPTVNGGICYDAGYVSNPLVFCGCLGILPHGTHRTQARDGDLIVVIGGRTGRDGLRGATFSSMQMDSQTGQLSGGAVQIGHPIHEKQVLEVVLRARDAELYNAITDCGAGGLSSAVGEMGEKLGATVHLERVPLKYPGLSPWEIWLSEAQERMVFAVPPENWEEMQAICDGQDVEAVAIGTYEATGRLTLYYGEKRVGDLAMAFLHDGIPQKQLEAVWSAPGHHVPDEVDWLAPSEAVLRLLASPNIRSKEDIIRRYDHEVQGGTAVKPLVGVANDGPADAAVIMPDQSQRGAALSVGYCPQYTALDPYAMAWAAVDEAFRNVVAVGADPDHVSILDNFSWGNADRPDRLGALVRCSQGCYDAAIAYNAPFVSGKDSLNNEYLGADGQRHAIPGTLVISALGIVPDVARTVTMDLKKAGNRLYLVGETHEEMGGSHYYTLHRLHGGDVPRPNPDAIHTLRALHSAIQSGHVRACHDLSEGGLAVALAEMCIAGRIGANIALEISEPDDLRVALFAESLTRFLVEVPTDAADEFEALFAGHTVLKMIGHVSSTDELNINDGALKLKVSELATAWRGHIDSASDEEISPESRQKPSRSEKSSRTPTNRTQPKVIVLHANGTNRDHDAALACRMAGGDPEIVHINQLLRDERRIMDYHMLVVPGGFSYGDDLGAGVLWALDLRQRLGDSVARFIADARPVLGICNGFQTLVKAGLLPGFEEREITLTDNLSGRFECRWVYLQHNPASPSLFTEGLSEPLYVPVAHGEGRVMARSASALDRLWDEGLIALRYVDANGEPAGYPANPNGSMLDIAALTNTAGNVFGLMPHPENHIFDWQHPRYHRGERGLDGLRLFANGLRFA
ncbi:MAG: phosphoribosylformylglycinamidine synthase subunit PurL [Anaerolineaceae bacterium]|nr:MAG: phosphoribosylformylglycinamidine synthase subunit PurL [Anaerolineaceae bacterium]